MNETERRARENYLPAKFGEMLLTFLDGAERVARAVLETAAVREPDKYRDAADHVKLGLLVPEIVARGGELTISLINASTGQSVCDVLKFTAPALEARGTQQ